MKKIFIITVITVIMAFLVFNFVKAENVDELRTKKQGIENQLSEANDKLSNIEVNLTETLEKINILDGQISENEEKIKELQEELNKLQEEIDEVQEKLNFIQADYTKQKDTLEKRLVALYETSETTYLDVLLSSKSISEFISNYYLISEIAQYDSDLLNNIEREKKQIENIAAILEEKKQNLENKKISQEKIVISLENARAVRNSYAKDLTEEEQQKKQEIEQYEQELNNLDSQILYLTLGDLDSSYVGGTFAWPTPGYTSITSKFGTRFHPILKVYRTHYGLDIGAPKGASIIATNSGVVTTSAYLSAYGNTVMIDHGGGVVTLYAHGSERIAKVGDHVEKGDIIMKVGSTGLSTGPHLHFGITVNGKYVDPYPYITTQKGI